MTDKPLELPAIDDGPQVEHPEDLTDEEAERGRALYEAVDDTDDEADWGDAP
jgi:hypothetical protein